MTSLYIFIGIIAFFLIAFIISNYIQRKKGNTQERETPRPSIDVRTKQERERDGGCCGQHEVCEKDSLIAAFREEPEYFDDEELNAYQGKDSASYNEEQAEEFREIFYSVLDEEKPRWVRSLQMRGISLPDQVKDEVLMVVNELRTARTAQSAPHTP